MKLAEEWIKEDMPSLPDVAIQPYAKWVRAIQLDAWRQGMTDAASYAYNRRFPTLGDELTTKCEHKTEL